MGLAVANVCYIWDAGFSHRSFCLGSGWCELVPWKRPGLASGGTLVPN